MSIPPQPSQRPHRRHVSEQDSEQESLTRQIFLDRSHQEGNSAQGAPDSGWDDSGEDQVTEMLSIEELGQIARETHDDELDGAREAVSPSITRQQAFDPQRQALRHEQLSTQQWAVYEHSPQVHGGAVPPVPPGQLTGGGDEGGSKKGLPLGAVLAIILAALLVIATIAFIVVDSQSGPTQREAAPPPPAAEETQQDSDLNETDENPSPTAEDVTAFVMPSGNIGCVIDSERVRCTIKEFDYDAGDAPDGCQVTPYGSVVVADKDSAGYSCETADMPNDPETFDYGQEVSAHGITCSSAKDGVTCRTEDGPSFKVARAGVDFSD